MKARPFIVFALAFGVILFVISQLQPIASSAQMVGLPERRTSIEISPTHDITSERTIKAMIESTHPVASMTDPSNAKNVEVIGHIGGLSNGIFVQGRYAYAGYGPELAVLDVSDPSYPLRVGYVLLPTMPQNIYVKGNYAYVADAEAGLRIIDVTNPARPNEVGSYTSAYAAGVWVENNYAYVVGYNHFRIIDISNVNTPIQIGQFAMPANARSADVVVRERYAYVADPWIGLRVIDVLTPTAPVQIGSFRSLNALNVAIANGYAYLPGEALFILDISNPIQPTAVSTYTNSACPAPVSYVRVVGTYAYTSLCRYLQVLDVSNPVAPVSLGRYEGDIGQFVVSGGRAYVATRWGSQLQIVDVSIPTTLTLKGSYQAPACPTDAKIVGDYAYVADACAHLRILNVSEIAAPYLVSSVYRVGNPQGIDVANDYAYVAGEGNGLFIVDVSDPMSPIKLGSYDTPGDAMQVAVTGMYAFVADRYNGGLRVIDVANPMSLTEVNSCCLPGDVWDVAVAGNYAYLANSVYGLRIMDITNPLTLTEVASYDTPGWAYSVAVAGDYAYIADSSAGLRIVRILTPTTPIEVGSSSTGGDARSVALDGQYAYVANRDGSLHVVDISNPYAPADVGFYNSPNPTGAAYGVGVAARNGQIYFGDWFMGLYILQYGSSVSGRVTDVNQRPFADVTVEVSSSLTTTVDAAGSYAFAHVISGTYVLTPALNGYAFWPVSRTVTVPPDARNQDFIILPVPVSNTLTPSMTNALLMYTDTQGLITQLDFSANVVAQTTTLFLTPTIASPAIGFAFAGHAFDLIAAQAGKSPAAFTFNAPVTVTVHYSDYDVRLVTDETQLALWWWNGSEWQDASQTCEPASTYVRDVTSNVLNIPICSMGRFGLFGPTRQIIIPLIMKSGR